MEEWKSIENYSRYKVSNLGRVWDNKTDIEVSQVLSGKPQYYYVNLNRDDGERKLVRVSRLIAFAFVEGRSNQYNIVDHVDRNKLNNHYTNLRWIDNSGNQRNTENSIWIDLVHIQDFIKKYDNPSAAYSHITSSLDFGLDMNQAIGKYEEYLNYGKKRLKVMWVGHEIYLLDLCKIYNKEYEKVSLNISKGWDIWNSMYSVPPEHHFSIEIKGKLVDHWYTSKEHFRKLHGRSVETLTKLLDKNYLFEDILSYDGFDYKRQTVKGVTGTIDELCEYFGVSASAVSIRMCRKNMSLEDALFQPRQRVKRISINGEFKNPKEWYEFFELNPRYANNYKSKHKLTFEETLIHFGINISDLKIEY